MPATVVPDGAGVGGEARAWEPARHRGDGFARPLELHQPRLAGGTQLELAQVDAGERFQVAANDEVVAEPGVAVAEVRVGPAEHQPVGAPRPGEIEANDMATGRQRGGREVTVDRPHQEVRIQVLVPDLEPALAPYAQRLDDGGQLLARRG